LKNPNEIIEERHIVESHLATGEDLDPLQFPQLAMFSPAFFYQFVPIAKKPEAPEIVFVPRNLANRHEIVSVLASWNWQQRISRTPRAVPAVDASFQGTGG
jgi:hypothetical protein